MLLLKTLCKDAAFEAIKKSKLRKTKTITQLSGSIQNCTTFDKIKKIVSIVTWDLNLITQPYRLHFL